MSWRAPTGPQSQVELRLGFGGDTRYFGSHSNTVEYQLLPSIVRVNAQIDVRATHIGGGLLSGMPIWHLFIIYTDYTGYQQLVFRGGPNGPGGGPPYGTIKGTHMNYGPNSVDWDRAAPSITVLKGSYAYGKDKCFLNQLDRINREHIQYSPAGPNSNTVAKTLLDRCGVPAQKPVTFAPGWNDPDL